MKLKILILKYKSIQACLYVGSWQCSVTCGIGTRHRTVQCRLDKQKGVNPRRCSKEKRPKAVEQCSEVRCSDYEWRKSVWSEVSTVKKIRFFFFVSISWNLQSSVMKSRIQYDHIMIDCCSVLVHVDLVRRVGWWVASTSMETKYQTSSVTQLKCQNLHAGAARFLVPSFGILEAGQR